LNNEIRISKHNILDFELVSSQDIDATIH
jgi:hypothetical protein